MRYYKKNGAYALGDIERCVKCSKEIKTQLDEYIQLTHCPERSSEGIPIYTHVFGVMCIDCFHEFTSSYPSGILASIRMISGARG